MLQFFQPFYNFFNIKFVYQQNNGYVLIESYRLSHSYFPPGWISIASPLDYESPPTTYHLTLRAWDASLPSIYSDARVNVVVQDVNDCAPVFQQVEWRGVRISEGAAVGTHVVTGERNSRGVL